MLLTQCPSSRSVPDRIYDLLHGIYDLLGDDVTSSISLGGAFSLNAHGVIDRPVESIDLCVLASAWDDVKTIHQSTLWTSVLLSNNTTDEAKYLIEGIRVCFYKHASFPENVGTINVHGQLMKLYPAGDIIRYKMAMLSDRSSTLTEARVRLHMADIISFLHRSSKQTRQTLLTTALTLVRQVNAYCKAKGFSTRYETPTNNDTRLEGLTFDIRLSSSSRNVEHSQRSDFQQGTL